MGWKELAKGVWLSPAGNVTERSSPPGRPTRSSTPQPRQKRQPKAEAAALVSGGSEEGGAAASTGSAEARLAKSVAKAVGKSVAAAAVVADAVRRPTLRTPTRRACCSLAARRWWLWSAWPLLCAAWFFGLPVKDTFTSLSRAARSVADLTEAAGEVAEAGAQATVLIAKESIRALSTTVDVAEELWRGVDLQDVHMHRSAVRATGADCKLVADWVESGGGCTVPQTLQGDLAALIGSVSRSVFEVEQHGDRFWAEGKFVTFYLRARWRRDGTCTAAFIVTNTSFTPVWMGSYCSYWEVFGFSPQSQSQQIVSKLYDALSTLKPPPADFLVIDDDTRDLWVRALHFSVLVGVGWALAFSSLGLDCLAKAWAVGYKVGCRLWWLLRWVPRAAPSPAGRVPAGEGAYEVVHAASSDVNSPLTRSSGASSSRGDSPRYAASEDYVLPAVPPGKN